MRFRSGRLESRQDLLDPVILDELREADHRLWLVGAAIQAA